MHVTCKCPRCKREHAIFLDMVGVCDLWVCRSVSCGHIFRIVYNLLFCLGCPSHVESSHCTKYNTRVYIGSNGEEIDVQAS
jgi:hypothetical protein